MNGKHTRRKSVKLYQTYAGVNWHEHYTAYEGTPPVTRFFGTACFLVNIATFFGLINVFHFVFDLQSVLQKYEYWRFLTSFLHFGFAFGSPVGFIYFKNGQLTARSRKIGRDFLALNESV